MSTQSIILSIIRPIILSIVDQDPGIQLTCFVSAILSNDFQAAVHVLVQVGALLLDPSVADMRVAILMYKFSLCLLICSYA